MTLFARFGRVVRAELGHLVRGAPPEGADDLDPGRNHRARTGARSHRGSAAPKRRPAVVDVAGALRVLELSPPNGEPSLSEVRAQYRSLARRYHPKTRSAVDGEAHAARVVMDALTDALELLEDHLLPV